MSGYSIITPDQRAAHLATQGPKILLTGSFGVGKTYTIRTIPKEMKTIVLDIESGLMTVNQWMRTEEGSHVQTIRIETYEDFEDITVLACGPDKSASPDSPMSQAHHDHVMQKRAAAGIDVESEKKMFQEADVFFIDSISDLTKLAFAKAKREETTNNLMRVYGNMGSWVLSALRHWQHNHTKTVIFSCKLSQEEDEMGRKSWVIETEGRKIKNELPGIVDEVITLADIEQKGENGIPTGSFKAFVCTSPNPGGYLAKDRSGRLAGIEQPHWGNLFKKMRGNGAEEVSTTKTASTPVALKPMKETTNG